MNSYKKATWNLNVLYTYISTYFHSKKLFCFDSDLKVLARSWWFAEKLDTYLAKKKQHTKRTRPFRRICVWIQWCMKYCKFCNFETMQLGNKNVKTLDKKNWCYCTGVVEWKRQKDGRSSSSYEAVVMMAGYP